jgi:RES domain-containing protein
LTIDDRRSTIDGRGGLRIGGRWHRVGTEIVYTAESSALAILEVLVHLEAPHIPRDYQLLRIEVPDALNTSAFSGDPAQSVSWGTNWAASGDSALAKVPSFVAPHAYNWLINPRHSDATGIVVADASRWPWDERLFR